MADASPAIAQEWDYRKIADLNEAERTRLIVTLLCHKAGTSPSNIDMEAARAATGAASVNSYRVALSNTLRKLKKDGTGADKTGTPKKQPVSANSTPRKKRAAEAYHNDDEESVSKRIVLDKQPEPEDDDDEELLVDRKPKLPVKIKFEPEHEEEEQYEYYG